MTAAETGSLRRYQFGDLALDVGQRRVTRGQDSLELGKLTFDFLRVLVESSPNLVTHDDLAEKVWGGRPVSPETVSQRVLILRQALSDDADKPRYIEVLRGQGYRLISDVKSERQDRVAWKQYGPVAIALTVLLLVVGLVAVDQVTPESVSRASESRIDSSAGTSQERISSPAVSSSAGVRRQTTDLTITGRLGPSGLTAEIAVSSTASHLVYSANLGQGIQLYQRPLDQFDAQPMLRTEFARMPFFSRDGESVVFATGMGLQLKKVPVSGGSPQTLAEPIGRIYGGSWGPDDQIVYSTTTHPDDLQNSFLVRVSADGGIPEPLTSPAPGMAHRWPDVLPDGKSVLFALTNLDGSGSDIAILSTETGEYRSLVSDGGHPRYAPTGHIVFARGGALWAVPFDLDKLEIAGGQVKVVEDLMVNSRMGHALFSISDNGLLVYVRGGDVISDQSSIARRSLLWVDREGNEETLSIEARSFRHPRLSPVDGRLAVTIAGATNNAIWIYDTVRGVRDRLTFGASWDEWPLWSPDGEHIIYSSAREVNGLFLVRADFVGEERRLTSGGGNERPETFSRDGSRLIYRYRDFVGGEPDAEYDLHALSFEGAPDSQPLLQTGFSEGFSAVSPDGRWLAYASDETGQFEVYVRSFPDVRSTKVRISIDGGEEPLWNPQGGELFFRSGDAVMVVAFEDESSVDQEVPKQLFSSNYYGFATDQPSYDVSRDGQRFLMIKSAEAAGLAPIQTSIAFVDNWFGELKRLVPATE